MPDPVTKLLKLLLCVVFLLLRVTPSLSQEYVFHENQYCLTSGPYTGAIINYVWRYHSYPESLRGLVRHSVDSYRYWAKRGGVQDKRDAKRIIRRLRKPGNRLYVSNDTCFLFLKREGYKLIVVGTLDGWQHTARELFEGHRPGYFDKKGRYLHNLEVEGEDCHQVPGTEAVLKKYRNRLFLHSEWLSSTVTLEYHIHLSYDRKSGLAVIQDPSPSQLFYVDRDGDRVYLDRERAESLASDYLDAISKQFEGYLLSHPKVRRIDCFIPLRF